MHHDTPTSGNPWLRRLSRGDPCAHRRLHDEKRGGDGQQSEGKCWQELRRLHPLNPTNGNQNSCKQHTDRIMKAPAEKLLCVKWCAGNDALVYEAPLQHMAEPAPYQPIIQARKTEQPFSRHCPYIGYECRSHSDENDLKNKHLPFLSTCADH